MNKALKTFKDAGDFEPTIRKWEAQPVAIQTWENLKNLMCTEYAKAHRQDSVSARATRYASAHNVMEEYAAASEELIENPTGRHTKQLEAIIKANNDNMTKLVKLLSKASSAATATPAATSTANSKSERAAARQKAWIEKCKNATKCNFCNKIHPNCTKSQCWEFTV